MFLVLAGNPVETEESKLKNHWPSNYDKDIRPVRNASQPLRVVFGVAIGQIIEVVSLCIHFVSWNSIL